MNVILVVNHDVSRDWFGCYGQPIHTPHLDGFARSGFLFDRHYCQYPLCGPSRASLFTGCRPDTTRQFDNTSFYHAFRERIGAGSATLPEHFRSRGYTTQAVGNIMGVHAQETMEDIREVSHDEQSWSAPRWEPPLPPVPPWAPDHSSVAANLRHYRNAGSLAIIRRRAATLRAEGKDLLRNIKRWTGPPTEMADVPDTAYDTGAITGQAVRFLGDFAASGRPFFLALGYHTNHAPWVAPQRYWDLYRPEELVLPRTTAYPAGSPVFAPHRAYTPAKFYTQQLYDRAWTPQSEQVLELRHAYFACVSYFDAQMGRLLQALDRLALADDTIVAITTDHGFSCGEHGHWHKQTAYEADHGVPLFVRVPAREAGSRVGALTEHVDLYPTLCELCGLDTPSHLEGTSFVPLLDDPLRPWKSAAFGQVRRTHPEDGGRLMARTMVTGRYRLTRWQRMDRPDAVEATELYEREDDPLETVNLADDPARAGELRHLNAMLDAGWRGALPR